ncbi:hypothetical protein ASD52_06675 [Ensifer sp. Root142]|uniref:TylF/MycF/NovP-related O-methyltransferase n=1 Tax=Ensifer sp. Root142 TaxID=1736461 RepID=UPI00070B34BE|nr:TylF/MycF/NovP-related O-methyltransferase [Ensifer sp. Root142]KQY71360.1 hypothetical protein ASD52_06675 [Ensifer sp. Root142]
MTYAIEATPSNIVDHAALSQMRSRLTAPGARAALVGFGEYAKHLINWHPDHVSVVYDPREWLQGITYKGAKVVGETAEINPDVNLVLVCEYDRAYGYQSKIAKLYPQASCYVPLSIDYKSTVEVDVFAQEEIYQKLFFDTKEVPVSMMGMPKIKFLMELLRYGLKFEGDVVEMGSWQGGSTWYMARMLSLLNENRKLFAMDLFETHMPDPTATMCTEEVEVRLKRQYENTELVVGLVDAPESVARVKGNICFAHIDLGVVEGGINFVWERLSRGAPLLLDNYGHLVAPTWEFDRIFEEKGTRVIRFPWSEQGLVFKS